MYVRGARAWPLGELPGARLYDVHRGRSNPERLAQRRVEEGGE